MSPHRKPPLDPTLLSRARAMRHDTVAPAEARVWSLIRDRQLGGFKFRRQHPLGPYIADFYCDERRLVVELDGASHQECIVRDARRDQWMKENGYRVVRFENSDVFEHLEAVLEAILEECVGIAEAVLEPSPRPSPGGRGRRRIEFPRHKFHPVIDLPPDYEVFDLTSGYDAFRPLTSGYGVGKYDEKRKGVYTTELFSGGRDIHIGIDIAAPVGTPCRAFCDGAILLQGYNGAPGDYGYTIVTRHELDRVELFALWGHLDRRSVELRKEGEAFRAGDVIGHIGDRHENGGWNPHLHFQLSYQRPTKPDMPGVVGDADRERALQTYPDPRLVLGPLY
jgi:very-short-patch-repair endonuclease